jgi:hypothetical protein
MLRSARCIVRRSSISLLHERRARHVLDEDGDVDLVGEGLLGVAAGLVAGRVDAGQVDEHHAGHGAAHGICTVTSFTARTPA